MPAEPPADLDFFLEILLAGSSTSALARREFEAAGLEQYQWGLLVHVEAHGATTPSQLAEEVGVGNTTIRDQVQWLVDRGYLVRKPNDDDRRSYFVELTPKGRAFLRDGRKAQQKARRRLERELPRPLESYREALVEIRRAARRALEG